jgi:hypothetical protein
MNAMTKTDLELMKFIRANIAAQSIADSANVAYWMAIEGQRTKHHADSMDKQFRELAAHLGYVVSPALEVAI